MRFAGQRFRAQRPPRESGRAESGRAGKYRAERGDSGMAPAMQQMPDKNAQSMAFTRMPDMSNNDFSAGNFSNPDFRAPLRIR